MKVFFIRWISITLGVLLASAWVRGFHVESLGTAVAGALVISAVSRLLGWLFSRTQSQPQPPPRPGEMKHVSGRVIDVDEL